jgi:2-methylcitrate dehydratase PrpD
VLSATLVGIGCDGVADPFAGGPNYLDALSDSPDRSQLCAELGERYEIGHTNIKKYAVASPAQAAVQAAETIATRPNFDTTQIDQIEISLPSIAAPIVDDNEMPDVNVQYLVAGVLCDRSFSFAMAHNGRRMHDPAIVRLREVTVLRPDDRMNGRRSAAVRVTQRDGTVHRVDVPRVRGTVEDPMTAQEIENKAADLIEPYLGDSRCAELISTVRDIEQVDDITELRHLLTPIPPAG